MSVGAPEFINMGCVYTYTKDSEIGTWIEGGRVFGSAEGAEFGRAVAVTSSGMLVGAPKLQREGPSSTYPVGAAFFYRYDEGSWNKVGSTIEVANEELEDFGAIVAASDNDVLV